MSARRRRPRRRTRNLLHTLWLLLTVTWRSRRPASAFEPRDLPRRDGPDVWYTTPADVIKAATSNYAPTEPCPTGLSAGACPRWHPAGHERTFTL